MEEYPEKAQQIKNASTTSFQDSPGNAYSDTNFLDFAVIVEAWHLPRIAGKNGSLDGRHTISVGQCVVVDEPYFWNRFPIELLYRDKPVQGIYGTSVPTALAPLQLEINRIMRTITQSQRLAVGHWFVEQNASINTNAINDIVASVIRYAGTKPEYIQYPAVTEDVYAYLWAIWQKGFEQEGISQMAAMALKPPGLDAAVAIDAYADVQSDRYRPAYREYQNWNKRITEQILHLAAEIADEMPEFQVKATGPRAMAKAITWADAGLKREEYSLKLKETNLLGTDVPEKMNTVANMAAAGYIAPDDAKRMLLEDGGMPDLEGYESLEASSLRFVEYCADAAIDDDDYIKPNVYMSPALACIAHMRKLYLKAQVDGVDDAKLRLLRQWMDEAAQLPTAGQQAAPPMGGPTPPGAPGAPMPPMGAAPPALPMANPRIAA
jgi:hypothetical protein